MAAVPALCGIWATKTLALVDRLGCCRESGRAPNPIC